MTATLPALPPSRAHYAAPDVGSRGGKAGAARREWLDWWAARADECTRHGPAQRCAAGQGFVLTVAQANQCGVDRAAVRRLVRAGTWWVPRRGVLAVVSVGASPDGEGGEGRPARVARRRRVALASAAAALTHPGQVVSGSAAAVLCGLPLYREPSGPQLTAGPPTTPGNRAGLLVRPAGLATDEIGSWFGLPVTTIARTVVDLARHGRRDGLIAADAALFAGAVRSAELDAALVRAGGWPGVRRARDVLALATPGAESALESLTRLRIHDSGLPLPEPQVEIFDPVDGSVYRVDGLWRTPAGSRVVLEVDGRVKYTDPAGRAVRIADVARDALWDEKRRQERLERMGYRVIRVMASDLGRGWDETYRRITDAIGAHPPASPTE